MQKGWINNNKLYRKVHAKNYLIYWIPYKLAINARHIQVNSLGQITDEIIQAAFRLFIKLPIKLEKVKELNRINNEQAKKYF